MFRRPLCFVLLATLLAVAERVEYDSVARPVLEERLRRAADKNSEREETLHELFEAAGCVAGALDEQRVKGSRTPNVICSLKGAEENTVVVGAHYDKVPEGHGIIDNWRGASLLPSLYQGLRSKPRRLTFVFIGFTDEEKELVGSKYYVSRLSKEDKGQLRAMVNIDSLGLSDTKIWLSRADKNLASAAGAVAKALRLPIAAMNVDRVGLSDSGPFMNAKIPVIDFHSLTQETFPILHSRRDDFAAMHLQEYENSYHLLAAYLVYLDATLGAPLKTSP